MTDSFLRLGLVFGAKLKYLRQRHGLTRESVAARLGLSVAELSGIEDGQRVASANTLHRAATLFSCQLSDLFHWPGGDPVTDEFHDEGDLYADEHDMASDTEIARDGAALVDAFVKIPNQALRAEVLKIVTFLSQHR